jgi:hypothetical protein
VALFDIFRFRSNLIPVAQAAFAPKATFEAELVIGRYADDAESGGRWIMKERQARADLADIRSRIAVVRASELRQASAATRRPRLWTICSPSLHKIIAATLGGLRNGEGAVVAEARRGRHQAG